MTRPPKTDEVRLIGLGRIAISPLRHGARAALAQLVEHHIRNVGVGCSSHPCGTSLAFQVV